MIDILLIGCVWVFVLDVSGAWNEMSAIVAGWITGGKIRKPFPLKPFSCSLCMTFWTGLLYLVCVGRMTLPMIAWVCLVAMLTPRIKDIMLVADELLAKLLKKIGGAQ